MIITLRKAARVPLNGPIRWPGYSADVDELTFRELEKRGVLDDGRLEPERIEAKKSDEPEDPEPESVPVPEGEPETSSRPSRTAPVKVWREYARSLGIKTEGLAKNEIIGAVDSLA